MTALEAAKVVADWLAEPPAGMRELNRLDALMRRLSDGLPEEEWLPLARLLGITKRPWMDVRSRVREALDRQRREALGRRVA